MLVYLVLEILLAVRLHCSKLKRQNASCTFISSQSGTVLQDLLFALADRWFSISIRR